MLGRGLPPHVTEDRTKNNIPVSPDHQYDTKSVNCSSMSIKRGYTNQSPKTIMILE